MTHHRFEVPQEPFCDPLTQRWVFMFTDDNHRDVPYEIAKTKVKVAQMFSVKLRKELKDAATAPAMSLNPTPRDTADDKMRHRTKMCFLRQVLEQQALTQIALCFCLAWQITDNSRHVTSDNLTLFLSELIACNYFHRKFTFSSHNFLTVRHGERLELTPRGIFRVNFDFNKSKKERKVSFLNDFLIKVSTVQVN